MTPPRPFFLKFALGALGGALIGVNLRVSALGAEPTPLEVAYAGSMTSVMEGPIKDGAAHQLNVALQGRAQGASGLAQLIVAGSIRPDVFISVTPGPMETVLTAGKAAAAQPIARTEMVIAYSPKSRFATQLANSGKRGAPARWQVLAQPGLRFGRTDPVTDPQGRNIIFTMQLAAQFYRQPDLVERILGPQLNPEQIFSEPTVAARLQSGELDAASAYKIQPVPFNLPYISLPDAINLGSSEQRSQYARAALTVAGRAYHPEPLVYYATVLRDAPHGPEARKFVDWLSDAAAQDILRRFGYDSARSFAPLHS